MHVDDAADAAVFLLRHWSAEEPINVGTGEDIAIAELAETIAQVVGFKGRFAFDVSKPDGAPRKVLDASRLLALGWRAQIGFDQGIRSLRPVLQGDRSGRALTLHKTTTTVHASTIGSYRGYNVVELDDAVALRQDLGPVDLRNEKPGDRDLAPFVLRCEVANNPADALTRVLQQRIDDLLGS